MLFSIQERIQIENGALTISNLNVTDSGMFQCIAENKHGLIYSSAELKVVGKTTFLCIWSNLFLFNLPLLPESKILDFTFYSTT